MIHRTHRSPVRGVKPHRRRLRPHPDFKAKLASMRTRLWPMVQISTGAVHPAFPRTILHFWLLTEAQLDSIAIFYHQCYPSPLTTLYPCPVTWTENLTMEEKRRKIGKFIGLRGCESPVVVKTEDDMMEEVRRHAAAVRSEDEIMDEVRRNAAREEEEKGMRAKLEPGFRGPPSW